MTDTMVLDPVIASDESTSGTVTSDDLVIGTESGVEIEDDGYDVTFYDELVSTKLYLCYAEVQKKLGIDLVVKTEKSRWQLILILVLVAIAIALILYFVLRVVLKVTTFGVI